MIYTCLIFERYSDSRGGWKKLVSEAISRENFKKCLTEIWVFQTFMIIMAW